MAVVEKRTRAGRTVTVQQYNHYGGHKGKRSPRKNPTPPAQEKGNMRRAVLQLTWLMNANFQDGDFLVTLDYRRDQRPENSDRMNKDFRNFFDRLKRAMKKLGLPPPKYIRVMEVGSKGARHHHLLLPKMDLELLRKCWTAGGVHVDPLYTDGNYRKIAEYFVKYTIKTMETENREMKKLWYPSKGLKKEKPGEPRPIKSRNVGDIKVPAGYYLDKDSIKSGISRFDGFETFTYILVKFPEPWPPGSRKKEKKRKEKRRGI